MCKRSCVVFWTHMICVTKCSHYLCIVRNAIAIVRWDLHVLVFFVSVYFIIISIMLAHDS